MYRAGERRHRRPVSFECIVTGIGRRFCVPLRHKLLRLLD
ncbi:hypothetical protein C7410_101185 [Paraburkholderia silvatlantica]|uniref:Uncharacterized protein n=1 Tax=Paraburkholderia silvatlantica TaxID=321895 RepID=A0A2V4UBD1_9BURK|nr:hypothetical protein C7410_101185 [Paraburkholderia silvatlantica]